MNGNGGKPINAMIQLTSFRIIALLLAFGGLQLLLYYPKLPDAVPYHFNFKGEPDAWGSRTFLISFDAGVLLFLALTFFLTARFIMRARDDYINLPHKEYWLAPERRDATIRRLLNLLGWIGVCTLLFIQYVMLQTLRAATAEPPQQFGTFWPVLLLYLAAVGGLVAREMWKFRRPSH